MGCRIIHTSTHMHGMSAACVCLHAEFFVTETPKGKVVDPRKLALIKRVREGDFEGWKIYVDYISPLLTHSILAVASQHRQRGTAR